MASVIMAILSFVISRVKLNMFLCETLRLTYVCTFSLKFIISSFFFIMRMSKSFWKVLMVSILFLRNVTSSRIFLSCSSAVSVLCLYSSALIISCASRYSMPFFVWRISSL